MQATVPDQPKVKNLFTIDEAREEFFENQISDYKFREMIRNGEIPSLRMGSKYLIRRSAIEAWISEKEQEAKP